MVGFEKLKVGIIGTGFGSLVHYPAFKQHTSFDPTIICGKQIDKTKKIASSLKVDYATNWTEVVNNEDIDVISISTPPKYHKEITELALDKGKHVLCEKPLAINLEEAFQMRDLAENSASISMANFEFRFLPSRAYFTELMIGGQIGDIYSLNIKINSNSRINPRVQGFNWWSEKTEGGGVLNALGSHYIDLLLQIFGRVDGVFGELFTHLPKRLNKQTGRMKKVTSDDGFNALFKLNGTQCSMQINTIASHNTGSIIEAFGSKGSLIIKEDQQVYGASLESPIKLLPIPTSHQLMREKDTHVLVPPMKRLLDNFISSINRGTSQSPNFSDGVLVQQVIESLKESHKKKKYIIIDI